MLINITYFQWNSCDLQKLKTWPIIHGWCGSQNTAFPTYRGAGNQPPVLWISLQRLLENHAQWSLTKIFHCVRAEFETFSIVYMVPLLLFSLGIANFLVMGIVKWKPFLLWANLNTPTEWKKMSLLAHWRNAKVNY